MNKYDEPVFQYREITINGENDATFRCSKGVKEGEEIVVNGAFRIDAAAQVFNKNCLMNSPSMTEGDKLGVKLVHH